MQAPAVFILHDGGLDFHIMMVAQPSRRLDADVGVRRSRKYRLTYR
jgi:hypothetical protein